MTLDEMDRRIAEWVATPEGQAELAATRDLARAAAAKVMADAKVTPEQMSAAITI